MTTLQTDMGVDVNTLRPMNDDVILTHYSVNNTSTIFINENEDEETTMLFEVLRVGNKAKFVSIGDIVSVPWKRCVPPFELNIGGVLKKATITSEKEILGILEK